MEAQQYRSKRDREGVTVYVPARPGRKPKEVRVQTLQAFCRERGIRWNRR